MATREELQAQIAEIDRVLQAGAASVRYGERYVSYDLDELRRRRAELNAQLAGLDGAKPVRRFLAYQSGRGW